MKIYPSPRNEKFKTLREFLDSQLTELLPNQDQTIKHHLNLINYLESESPLYVVRKFKNHSNRGNIYFYENHQFTVADNEPALWVFMESFYQVELDFSNLIANQIFPIAFAVRKDEKEGIVWKTKGRKHQDFSKNGWKHCHLFQCSPTGEELTHFNDLKRRSLRLLSPLNHFPFFSPRKYQMPFDYGEKKECIEYLIWWLYNHFYSDINKPYFKTFVEGQNFTIPTEEPKDLSIEYSIKNNYHSETKNPLKTNANTKNIKKITPTKLQTNNIENQKESTCFKISKKWYGQGLVITVRFNNGRVYQYNHDEVYDNTIFHYETLPCWEKYGYYSSSKSIPEIAQNFLM
jgi:hypothetical protein